ncbi:hypothetical protein [Polynucleobacter sp. AP-Nickl1-40-C4]|uniref:hypothetical protein n=1 Tax=Polynucleobacter sp. AP-Nickl1-40-C4 TaxID=3108275 RepID=UPI002B23C762|nr:hypothetical protein [Polynucleobacter sp. AP-Nickl1-40-C4]MEA9568218.1 hypothetical protein [Polynucleobacter sp. AP-Nickl1-40-C4]
MKRMKCKYIFPILLALSLMACTKTEKWGYEINHPAEPRPTSGLAFTAYKEIKNAEVQYKNNLVSIKETYIATAHSVMWGSGLKDDPIDAKTKNEIIGPCQYVDDKNWKCGKYQMFNGELKDEKGKMFRE